MSIDAYSELHEDSYPAFWRTGDTEMTRREEVKTTYDRIAAHFAQTRQEPWAEVAQFVAGRSGAVGLDIGVGNGRHAALLADVVSLVVGMDISRSVLTEATIYADERGFSISLLQGDAVALPVRSGSIDIVIYVATIHHLPTRAQRVRSLNEVNRVLADEGVGIVSAWSTEHERFDRSEGFDTMVDWTLPDGRVVPRFYHIYDRDEFARDIAASAVSALDVFVAKGNCYAHVTAGESDC